MVFGWMRIAVIAVALTGTAGCQGGGRPPVVPPTPPEVRISRMLGSGQVGEALAIAVDTMQLAPDRRQEMQTAIAGIPDPHSAAEAYFSGQIATMRSVQDAKIISFRMRNFGKEGVLSEGQQVQLMAGLQDVLAQRITAGGIAVDASDTAEGLPILASPAMQRVAFDQSMKMLLGGPAGRGRDAALPAVLRMAAEAGRGSYFDQQVRQNFGPMKLSRSELSQAAAYYPDLAPQALAAITVAVTLTVDPQDRLLLEDLKAALAATPGMVLADGEASLQVKVRTLQFQESRMPERSETVIYADYQVYGLGRGMSYLYEHHVGGADIDYAFEISAGRGGQKAFDELLRGRESQASSSCSSARIQNRRGGTEPAGFAANEDMASRCGNGPATVDVRELRLAVIGRLAAKIRAIPEIATAAAVE